MYAAPVGRAAYWVVRRFGAPVLRRVPNYVLSSARRTSQAWRAWGNKFARVVGRTVGGSVAAGAGALGVSKMPMKRKAPYAERVRAASRTGGMYRRVKRRIPVPPVPQGSGRPAKPAVRTARRTIAGMSRNYSKRKSRINRFRKIKPIANVNVPFRIERQQIMKLENDSSAISAGGIIMSKQDASLTGGTTMPVFLFDLTAHNNTAVDASTSSCQYLIISDTGTPMFGPLPSQLPDGTTSSDWWKLEYAPAMGSATTGFTRIQNCWYDIRLKLYGCRKQSVTYDVQLVQFPRGYINPFGNPVTGAETFTRNMFWQTMSRRYVTNSIAPQPFDTRRYMKVLKSARYTLPASFTTDMDTNPPSVDVKWFVKDGRLRKYMESNPRFTTDTAVQSTQWLQTTAVTVTDRPHYSQQVFLLVRATDMSFGSLPDVEDTPSFDAVIRRKAFFYR